VNTAILFLTVYYAYTADLKPIFKAFSLSALSLNLQSKFFLRLANTCTLKSQSHDLVNYYCISQGVM